MFHAHCARKQHSPTSARIRVRMLQAATVQLQTRRLLRTRADTHTTRTRRTARIRSRYAYMEATDRAVDAVRCRKCQTIISIRWCDAAVHFLLPLPPCAIFASTFGIVCKFRTQLVCVCVCCALRDYRAFCSCNHQVLYNRVVFGRRIIKRRSDQPPASCAPVFGVCENERTQIMSIASWRVR